MITIKTPDEIKTMREGGKILSRIMKELERAVRPGITTKDLDKLAKDLVLRYGAMPSFKGYKSKDEAKPYPAALCASVNEEIVHAVPSDRILKEGDIVSLDLGVKYKGFHTDMAKTLPVGKINQKTEKLINTAKEALEIGIKEVKPGNHFGDIGFAIQHYVESWGFNVVRDLCGHGIGRSLHEEPEVLNFGERGTGQKLLESMVFCIEPMVVAGGWRIKKFSDGFGYQTADGKLSCHFEYTVAVERGGCLILTQL